MFRSRMCQAGQLVQDRKQTSPLPFIRKEATQCSSTSHCLFLEPTSRMDVGTMIRILIA